MAAVRMQTTSPSKALPQASSLLLPSSFLRPLTCPPMCICKPFSPPAQGSGISQQPGAPAEAPGERLPGKATTLPPAPASPSARARCSPRVLGALAPSPPAADSPLPGWALSQGPGLSSPARLASLGCSSLLEPNVYAGRARCQLARNMNTPMAEQQSLPKDPPRRSAWALPLLPSRDPRWLRWLLGAWRIGIRSPRGQFICFALS